MMWIQLLMAISLATTATMQRSFAQFEIRKRHTSNDKAFPIGKLQLSFLPTYNTIEPSVTPFVDEFINEDDFANNHQAILEFVCVETDLPEYKDRVYLTSVDQITKEPHGQKIAIVLGPQSQSLTINAINYVQTRDRVGQIYPEIVETKVKEDQIFRYDYAPKKSEAENESFFAKYKWPLIIGGAVVYLMMSTAGGSGAAGAGAGGR